MGIRIYSPDEVLAFASPCFGGWDVTHNGNKISGVYINNDQKVVTKEMTIKILDKINDFFPLHWCDVDILCLPFRPMLKKKGQWTGTEFNGQAWKGMIALGAQLKVGTELFASTMVLHELWHEFAYRFVDETPFDGKDTKEYVKFKEIMGIKEFKDNDIIWEDRPSEILAELGRYYADHSDFTWEKFITFDDAYDPKPLREAYDYLMSLMPEKSTGKEIDFIENRNSEMPKIPSLEDIIMRGGDDMRIEMEVGSKDVFVDGVWKVLDVAPEIKNNRTLVPIRFISEEMGCTVDYNNGKIVITRGE